MGRAWPRLGSRRGWPCSPSCRPLRRRRCWGRMRWWWRDPGGARSGSWRAAPDRCCCCSPTSTPRSGLVGGLLAGSVINQLAATAVGPTAPLVRDVLVDHVYLRLLAGEVPAPGGPSNLGVLLGVHGVGSLAPLVLIWALALPMLV